MLLKRSGNRVARHEKRGVCHDAQKQIFNHELVSNGKISARGMADLRFESGEVIAHIWVKNGDRVRKGQKLAELDKFKLDNQLSQSEDALKSRNWN